MVAAVTAEEEAVLEADVVGIVVAAAVSPEVADEVSFTSARAQLSQD